MRFADLRIGARFVFESETHDGETPKTSWEKISPRKYRHENGQGVEIRVYSLNALVVSTDPFETADEKTSAQIAEWLKGYDCYDLVPCTVVIGESSFAACAYKQDREPLPGAPNQSRHTMEAIYCLGAYPTVNDREKVCYTRADDTREWFLSSHLDWKGYRGLTEEQRERFHPFGATFLLCPWSVPSGEKIDSHEEKPYRRIPLTVQPNG